MVLKLAKLAREKIDELYLSDPDLRDRVLRLSLKEEPDGNLRYQLVHSTRNENDSIKKLRSGNVVVVDQKLAKTFLKNCTISWKSGKLGDGFVIRTDNSQMCNCGGPECK